MADPFSTSDGVETNVPGSSGGSEEASLDFYIGHNTQEILDNVKMQANAEVSEYDITSVRSLLSTIMTEYSAEVKTMVAPLHRANSIMVEYSDLRSVNWECPELPSLGYRVGSEKLNRRKMPDVTPKTNGIVGDITTAVRCTQSQSCRIVLYYGLNDFVDTYGLLEDRPIDKERIESLSFNIEQSIDEFLMSFNQWLSFHFKDGRMGIRAFEKFPGLARHFALKYKGYYYKTVAYEEVEERFGEDVHDDVEEAINEYTDVQLEIP